MVVERVNSFFDGKHYRHPKFMYNVHKHLRSLSPAVSIIAPLIEHGNLVLPFLIVAAISFVRVNQIYRNYQSMPLSPLQRRMKRRCDIV